MIQDPLHVALDAIRFDERGRLIKAKPVRPNSPVEPKPSAMQLKPKEQPEPPKTSAAIPLRRAIETHAETLTDVECAVLQLCDRLCVAEQQIAALQSQLAQVRGAK